MKKVFLKPVQVLVILILIFTVSCKKIEVTGVGFEMRSITLPVGETEILTPIVFPENATNKAVSWTSDDPLVATVDNGKVTAKKIGDTFIHVTTKDGNYTASIGVLVRE